MKNKVRDDRRFKRLFLHLFHQYADGEIGLPEMQAEITVLLNREIDKAWRVSDWSAFNHIRARVDRCLCALIRLGVPTEVAVLLQSARLCALENFALVLEARLTHLLGIPHHLTNTGQILRAWKEGRLTPSGRL